MENKIITRTTNVVDFEVSKESYNRAKKKIEDVGKSWEKVDQKVKSASRQQLESNKAIIQANNLEAKRLQSQNRLNAAKEKERAISAKTATQRKKETADQLRAESKLQRELGKRFTGQRGPRTHPPLPTAAEMVPAVQALINAHSPESKANAAKAAAQAMRQAKKEEARLAREAGKAEKRRLDYARKRYLTIRSEAFKIQNIEGLTNAERAEAILKMRRVADQQQREALNAQETRFELRKITQELQKQARLRRRMANQRTHGGNFGGRSKGVTAGVGVGLAGAAGAAAAGLLAVAGASMAVASTLRESFERQKQYSGLKEQGVSATDADAILLAANQKGAGISLDKLQDQFVDYRDKVGDLSLGQWKTDKKGNRTYSGGGELADVANLVESKQAGAGTGVIKRLQSTDFKGYLSYLRELQKQYKLTDSEMTLFGEFIDDGSKTLRAFDQNGQIAADALKTVKNSSLYLTDAQREQVGNLQSSMMLLGQASSGLADNFTLGFAEAFNSSDELTKAMESLAPVMEGLGRASADVLNSFVRLFGWLSHILPSVGGDGTAAGIKESYTGSRDMTPKSEQPEKGFWENLFDFDSRAFLPQEYGGKAPNLPKPLQVPDNLPALAPFKDLKVTPAPVPTFSPSSLTQSAVNAKASQQTVVVKQEPLQVNIQVNDGTVKDLVNATVDDRERDHLNMMTQGGQ
ncbi:TPA: hypothetical protein ACXJGM_000775 [Escherichia coli]|uniref:Uncharacterized protein n=1 Tax=Kosakonia arachidis TaxID=551989 RepID=A0A1I7B6N7_9ENTR|nr:hypothetical protein [Kosakonia arachidis]SFT82856.1 hypothetical protein SAMN05192562_102337 [Kosakonia arachidis]HCX5473382.1 hypothetical protein [Escherichia coli]HDQ4220903.1 hypothetical protein [Escherichia coli]HEI3560931.1 hypothetical protein [Escherichia coli]